MAQAEPANLTAILPVVVLASSVSIMSTDIYTPSLPHLPEYFATTPQAVQLTISLNIIAFALAQLVLGPVSDRFGRRPVMLTGLGLFTVASIACAASQSIGQLITMRSAQGLSAAVEAGVGLAIIRDLFKDTDQVRALAIWGMAISITPAAAPILGGYVHVWLGWRANFWLVAACAAAITFLIWRMLPESTTPDRSALQPRRLGRAYWQLVRNRPFMGYVLVLGTSLGVIFAFITAGPFILIEQFSVPTHHYGYYQGVIVAAFFLGSLSANRLASRMTLRRLFGVGIAIFGLGAAAVPAFALLGALTPNSLVIAMSVSALGLGPIFAVGPSFALGFVTRNVGAASALIGSGEMLICGLASGFVTALHDGSSWPFAWAITLLLVAACIGWRMTDMPRRRSGSHTPGKS